MIHPLCAVGTRVRQGIGVAALSGQETAGQGWALRTWRLGAEGSGPPGLGGRWGVAGRPWVLSWGFRGRMGDAEGLAVCPLGPGMWGRVLRLGGVSLEPRPWVFSCVFVD